MERCFEGDNRLAVKKAPKFLTVLFVLYIFLSYFETYLTKFFGSNTRFLILLIAIIFLYLNHWRIRKTVYTVYFFLWFLFKVFSIVWSNGANTDVSRLFFSQIGIIIFLSAVCGQVHDNDFLKTTILANYWSSFLFGIMSI